MALVTVQRSPSVTGSPQCSNSDSEADEDEGSKNEKSECFFAGKGTALVLALKDIPQYTERRLSTDSIRSTNSTQSNNSDIQQHLQSMFNLIRKEETLKMAVKLESQRANRTRYLVIASRCCIRSTTTERRSKIMRHNSARVASTSSSSMSTSSLAASASAGGLLGGNNNGMTTTITMGTTRQLSVDSNRPSSQHLQQIDDNWVELRDKRFSGNSSVSSSSISNRQSFKCDASDKTCASGDSKISNATITQTTTANSNITAGSSTTTSTTTTTTSTNSNITTTNTTISNAITNANTASTSQDCVGVEESCLLGIDCNERTTIGLVVPILADTTIHLDGDGGFSVSVYGKTHIFKPVSVQAMWSALQTLHKVSQKARENNFYPGGPSHDWLSYYESRIESEQSCLNEWNAMDSIESRRPPSPDAIRNKPTAKEETESVIKMKLKEIMMSVDLDEVTSKYIRSRLEEHLDMDLGEYKSFIDEEMLMILGQMDAPTEIFDHVYLGSEWNASNLEELQKNGVRHILNVTREIDNFFPGMFDYLNVRVYDDEKTNLLKHWDNTYRYITRAKAEGSKVLVHCKMGVSRSASVVIAYAMKAYNWEFQKALQHVKQRRNCIKPNKNFLNQLETYRGMLDAMKNKEKLQRSKSETNLKSTKDARLLPGSEPTPLIQALNHQSKSKSGGDSNDVESVVSAASIDVPDVGVMTRPTARSDHKHRRFGRRSSSTSPRTIQSPMATTIVMKQQSQSLENLTPDRSIAEEPKNMRFPGSNGENYSVTQNQVLHIQKHTPPLNTALFLSSLARRDEQKAQTSPSTATSVRTIVYDLENHQTIDAAARKDETLQQQQRRTLNLPFEKTNEEEEEQVEQTLTTGLDDNGKSTEMISPVWTSSAKLITQTSNISTATSILPTTSSSSSSFNREEAIQKRPHNRKTQSWAATSGGIIMDAATCRGSNSSIDSISTQASAPTSVASYEGIVRTRSRQRELPSRHASWGSGDTRCGMPMRNSSWGAFDTNRNSCQYNFSQHTNANAIFEGQIHELNTSNKTASTTTQQQQQQQQPQHHFGTVKRTKQKLEECTALKKLCQENGSESENTNAENTTTAATTTALRDENVLESHNNAKRTTNLFRSASAASGTRTRFAQRCNSEEIVPSSGGGAQIAQLIAGAGRRSDGNRPLNTDIISASAPEPYTMSDIENKNTLTTGSGSDEENSVILRATTITVGEDQRISGNVQILKKSFEAKAGSVTVAAQGQMQTTNNLGNSSNKPNKGHQSLPSSPVAQHVDHQTTQQTTKTFLEQTNTNTTLMTTSATESDRNVKGLVHKYQTSTAGATTTLTTTAAIAKNINPINPTSCSSSSSNTSSTNTITSMATFKPRPRSYYEAQRSLSGKPHEFSESRPPPAPQKTTVTSQHLHQHQHHHHHHHHHHQQHISEGILTQQQPTAPPQQRRLQQHGKTHPLSRLRLPNQSFNAAAYNTM
ncbi:protein phosphatase Slingshot isoform 2-T2 [Cochliomyia hominivorax]